MWKSNFGRNFARGSCVFFRISFARRIIAIPVAALAVALSPALRIAFANHSHSPRHSPRHSRGRPLRARIPCRILSPIPLRRAAAFTQAFRRPLRCRSASHSPRRTTRIRPAFRLISHFSIHHFPFLARAEGVAVVSAAEMRSDETTIVVVDRTTMRVVDGWRGGWWMAILDRSN